MGLRPVGWFVRALQLLKQKFAEERPSGRLILYCEDTSKTYTSEFVAAVLDDEGHREGLFEARSEHLGVGFVWVGRGEERLGLRGLHGSLAILARPQHLQLGGVPSPLDRYNGARWAAMAVDFLEQAGTRARTPAPGGRAG